MAKAVQHVIAKRSGHDISYSLISSKCLSCLGSGPRDSQHWPSLFPQRSLLSGLAVQWSRQRKGREGCTVRRATRTGECGRREAHVNSRSWPLPRRKPVGFPSWKISS